MDNVSVPAAVRDVLTARVAAELAEVYEDQIVFPERMLVDHPRDGDRLFPGWRTPVLVISIENQGVCAWGVPAGDPDPPVLVGGDLFDMAAETTVPYASNIGVFVAARRWDAACLSQAPMLQAQAAPLDTDALEFLGSRFAPGPSTAGWPSPTQHRFADEATRIMLWSSAGQCDWWISSTDRGALRGTAEQLLNLSDLRTSLWSNDEGGELLLRELREES